MNKKTLLTAEHPETIEWALTVLNKPLTDIIPIVQTPWSSVFEINTGAELFYLKHTPKLIALEASIIQTLREKFQAPVPIVIAHNSEFNCFLMKGAGQSLRGILKKKFDMELLYKAIDQFISLQLTVADYTNIFFDMGVPDWRLDKLPELYQEAIFQKDILIEDGLSQTEVSQLEALSSKVYGLCKKLSDYSIPQTIVQPDFNDNNTLIDNLSQTITIIDLGEISISHPFFSLLNFLQQMRKHYAFTENNKTYLKIKDTCLENYRNFASKKNLLDIFEIAQILWFVYGLVAQYRLMQACGKEKLMAFQPGKISGILKEFISVCK